MKKIMIEMPVITECMVNTCSYNVGSNCHARAITVGDGVHPGCDTFLQGPRHTRNAQQSAGIGACKIMGCKHNDDLECMADSVKVGMIKNEANCMTFSAR
ncbi:MAG: DUF1540 domain-containing protein [Gammaproteobacteria bacterium]|nr:DUF1540 domain-containing protein [Gammaproteobacteria bacterium]MBU1731497.1 DUF1540 domain-containing protein [Gammaproteobacteria bacterium]MBU1893002.1 DUF1540 domain-containing protein [Gammaproteobacteria bacterium]